MSRRPLEGLRVLDFTHVLAGPFCTRLLADMGADVVKVNSHVRALATNGPEHPYYVMWNRNKRALALDLTRQDARATCKRLCEQADVVIDNFAVGVLERWGVGYEAVRVANPRVIYVQMSGMGEGGPWSGFVTYAPTIHAISGLTRLTSVPGREDIGIGVSYNDHQAGLHSATAILASVDARRRTGKGQRIDMSQFETGVNFHGPTLLDLFANGRAAHPVGNDLPYDAVAPHNVYPCLPRGEGTAGERWVAIACMTDAQWQALCGLLGSPAWANASELAQASGRVARRAEIDAQIAAWTRTQQAEAVMARCQAAGVPAGVVQDGVDLVDNDPQLKARGWLRPVEDPDGALGPMTIDRIPLRFERTPCEVYRRVRKVGEDNAAVLADWLGMDVAEVDQRQASGELT